MRRAARTPPCPVRKENRDKPVLVAWWKNNSFTTAALQADQTYDKLKAQGK